MSPTESTQIACGPQNLPGALLRSLPNRPMTLPSRSRMLTWSSSSEMYTTLSLSTYMSVGRSRLSHMSTNSPSVVNIWMRLFSRSSTYTLSPCTQIPCGVWNSPGLSLVLRSSRASPGSPHDFNSSPDDENLCTRLLRYPSETNMSP